MHGVSNESSRFRLHILEALDLVLRVKRVKRLAAFPEFYNVGLTAFDVRVRQVVLGLRKTEVQLARACTGYVESLVKVGLVDVGTSPHFWLGAYTKIDC